MFPRLLTFWREIRSSLWGLPLLIVAIAVVAAVLAVRFRINQGDDPVWFLYSGSAEQAPQFLSNLVTAMITMATLVVSITMVVLTLAAQQLGPRLIRSFMADRRTQVTLGLFIATVVYLLLVLRATYGDASSVPNLAVTLGTALVLLCLLALLVFVHHLARSIIADTIINRVGAALDADLKRLLPDSSFQEHPAPLNRPRDIGASLSVRGNGYIQALDYKQLVDVAAKADALIELPLRTGHHVVQGSILGWVMPSTSATDELRDKVQECLVLGDEWESANDLETSIRQLVEVALRALSPSLNDPFTAMAVVDRLTECFAKAMHRGAPQSVWTDDEGHVRLLIDRTNFGDLIEAAFCPIRQSSTGQPAVLTRLVQGLGQLLIQADEVQRPPLVKQIEIVLDVGRRHIAQMEDLIALEACVERALARQPRPLAQQNETARAEIRLRWQQP